MTNLEWRYLPSYAALTKHEVRKTTNTAIHNSSFILHNFSDAMTSCVMIALGTIHSTDSVAFE